MDKPGFIIPPPGLIPAAPDTVTDTRRTAAPRPTIPVFVSSVPGQAAEAPATAETPVTDVLADNGAPSEVRAWRLILPDGSRLTMPPSLVLGRNPQPTGEWHSAAALSVDDPERSVSKTHAVFLVDGTDLVVVDLHSTNGVVVVTDDGRATTVAAGDRYRIEASATVELGRFSLRAERD
ncbi:MAG: FHA domain-containing protein [Leifsonia sp.]